MEQEVEMTFLCVLNVYFLFHTSRKILFPEVVSNLLREDLIFNIYMYIYISVSKFYFHNVHFKQGNIIHIFAKFTTNIN